MVAPTASATPAARYNNVVNPNIQPSFPLPNPGNGVLNSPLQGALTADQTQNISYSVPMSWTLPQFLPQLPVYPIARVPVTGNDVVGVAHALGAPGALDMVQQTTGAIVARVQVDGAPYTLTVYAGYGAPWFKLQADAPLPGTISSVRLRDQAAAWLQAHNLLHPDMRLLSIADGVVQYGQTVSGTTVLGSTALSFSFDSRGALRDLTDEYIVPHAPFSAPAASSNNAASDAIGGQQGFYNGPPASTVTGPAAVSALTLAYVGVQGTKNDYLQPVYVLSGAVPTSSSSPQPFAIYISALSTGN